MTDIHVIDAFHRLFPLIIVSARPKPLCIGHASDVFDVPMRSPPNNTEWYLIG
jgi:hypothetical protein